MAEHAQQIERDATIAMQDSETCFVHDCLVHLLHVVFLFPQHFFCSVFAHRVTSVLGTSATGLNALNDTRKREPVFSSEIRSPMHEFFAKHFNTLQWDLEINLFSDFFARRLSGFELS